MVLTDVLRIAYATFALRRQSCPTTVWVRLGAKGALIRWSMGLATADRELRWTALASGAGGEPASLSLVSRGCESALLMVVVVVVVVPMLLPVSWTRTRREAELVVVVEGEECRRRRRLWLRQRQKWKRKNPSLNPNWQAREAAHVFALKTKSTGANKTAKQKKMDSAA